MKQMTLNVQALRLFLDENNITEAEFARDIGVAHGTVNRVMNGKRNAGGKFISGLISFLRKRNLGIEQFFIFNNNLPKGESAS